MLTGCLSFTGFTEKTPTKNKISLYFKVNFLVISSASLTYTPLPVELCTCTFSLMRATQHTYTSSIIQHDGFQKETHTPNPPRTEPAAIQPRGNSWFWFNSSLFKSSEILTCISAGNRKASSSLQRLHCKELVEELEWIIQYVVL